MEEQRLVAIYAVSLRRGTAWNAPLLYIHDIDYWYFSVYCSHHSQYFLPSTSSVSSFGEDKEPKGTTMARCQTSSSHVPRMFVVLTIAAAVFYRYFGR